MSSFRTCAYCGSDTDTGHDNCCKKNNKHTQCSYCSYSTGHATTCIFSPLAGFDCDQTSDKNEGIKFDSDKKERPELIAPEFISSLSEVLAFGAKKYGDRNWEAGMKWSRPFGALMRHMWAWWRTDSKDSETGLSHLAHAACCLMFLVAYETRGAGTDNRYRREHASNSLK